MDKIIKRFIKAGLIYFVIASSVGVAFVTFPALQAFVEDGPGSLLKWVHAHVNLLGWVSMTLAAAVYWVAPRASGRPIFSEGLAKIHFWLVNIGLIGMAIVSGAFAYLGGKMFQSGVPVGQIYGAFTGALIIDLVFAFIELAGILVFVYNVWKTVADVR